MMQTPPNRQRSDRPRPCPNDAPDAHRLSKPSTSPTAGWMARRCDQLRRAACCREHHSGRGDDGSVPALLTRGDQPDEARTRQAPSSAAASSAPNVAAGYPMGASEYPWSDVRERRHSAAVECRTRAAGNVRRRYQCRRQGPSTARSAAIGSHDPRSASAHDDPSHRRRLPHRRDAGATPGQPHEDDRVTANRVTAMSLSVGSEWSLVRALLTDQRRIGERARRLVTMRVCPCSCSP